MFSRKSKYVKPFKAVIKYVYNETRLMSGFNNGSRILIRPYVIFAEIKYSVFGKISVISEKNVSKEVYTFSSFP